MELIHHEIQEGQLCAQHCLNTLLQCPVFDAIQVSCLGIWLIQMNILFYGIVATIHVKQNRKLSLSSSMKLGQVIIVRGIEFNGRNVNLKNIYFSWHPSHNS